MWSFSLFIPALAVSIAGPMHQEGTEFRPRRELATQSSTEHPKDTPAKKNGSQISADAALHQAIQSSGSDRAALVKHLEGFLANYPDYPNRTQIYRALVEAFLHLQDNARAADYAERMVALNPSDISILILAIQLLEQQDNEAGLKRAVSYSTSLIEAVRRTSADQRSPRVSADQWELEKKENLANTYFLRGDLSLKLKDFAAAGKDLQESYETIPNAGAAAKLGEIAELQKELNLAILQYGRAFALAEGKDRDINRTEIRKKMGNVWRLAHGSEEGLGDYLLHAFDDVARSTVKRRAVKNESAHQFSEFTVRKAPDGVSYPLSGTRGKVVIVNFWTTWCGPCHALEPQFARVARTFESIPATYFISVNCDEDETLVGPYLRSDKISTDVVFADGLERLFSVDTFPTVMVLDRDGKITYRAEGFDPELFEHALNLAIARALDAPAPNER